MSFRRQWMKSLALLAVLSVVSGCANRVTIRPIFPPAADVQALQESKPRPTPDILTSSQAEAQYNADIEAWGERLSSSGRRLCMWLKSQGAKDLSCKK